MELHVRDVGGQTVLEGSPGKRLMQRVDDVARVLEECFANGTRKLLLYPENLTERFFDLSSGEAGAILQKLRDYHVRLAVVRTPALQLSSRFGELLADESPAAYFRLLDDRQAAEEWLAR